MAKKKAKKTTKKKPAKKATKKAAPKKATKKVAKKKAAKKATMKKAAPKKSAKKVAKPAAKKSTKPKVPSLQDIAADKVKNGPMTKNPFVANDLRDVGGGLGADVLEEIDSESEDAYGHVATKESEVDDVEDDAFEDIEDEEDDEEGLF